jgi:hypothetical protein
MPQQQGATKDVGIADTMDDDAGPVIASSTSSTLATPSSAVSPQAGAFDEARWQQWLSGVVAADPARETRQGDYGRLHKALAKASADVAANAATLEQARHFARGCAYGLFGVGPGADRTLTMQGVTRRRIDALNERIDRAFDPMGS